MAYAFSHLLPIGLLFLGSFPAPLLHPSNATDIRHLSTKPMNRANECISDSECLSHQYCNIERDDEHVDYHIANIGQCLPRVGKFGSCRTYSFYHSFSHVNNCQKGLRCSEKDGKGTVCMHRLKKGKKCDPEEEFGCEHGLTCSKKEKKCIFDNEGLLGSKCESDENQCKESMGLYCKDKSSNGGKGTCQKKLSPGMECSESLEKECHGICVSRRTWKFGKPVCIKTRELGQLCNDDSQCPTAWRHDGQTDRILCNWRNEHTGLLPKYGICALEKNLIKTAGQECNPKMNLCDFRRDMTCEKVQGKFVCIQKGGRMIWRNKRDNWSYRHCTPGSRYSTCPGQECRRLTKDLPKREYGSYFCLEPRVVVKRGQICSMEEYVQCEEGTECVEAQGVRNGVMTPLGYCMKRGGKGSNCRDLFRTACAPGLHCRKGKCTTTKSKIKISYAGVHVRCSSKRPCAPGLYCRNGQCDVVSSDGTAKLGESCEEKSCEKGTACQAFVDFLRCQKSKGNEGSRCHRHKDCTKGLKCSKAKLYLEPELNSDNYSMCYNPSRSKKQGEKCRVDETDVSPISRYPQFGAPLPECYIPKSDGPATKCLRKGKTLVCQNEATLFEYCSSKENIACEKGLVCHGQSFCVGPNEE